MPEKISDIQHTHYALLVYTTTAVQGIRNDDQSLSPVTPLVSLLFLLFLIPCNILEDFKFTIVIIV